MHRVQTNTVTSKLPNATKQVAKKSTPTTATKQQSTKKSAVPPEKAPNRFISVTKRSYRSPSSPNFDYHLSKMEIGGFENSKIPMKTVPSKELMLIRAGQRTAYLETRYEHTPDTKYYYPEATNWRIGWFHRKDTST